MVIKFILKTELGDFESETIDVSIDQYKNLLELSKSFYSGGYEMYLPNGFLVASPDIISKSILIIETLKQ